MENQHNKIQGYRDFDQATIDMINHIKQGEKIVADLYHELRGTDVDQRELSLARTKFEEAFMHLVKSVAQPDSPWK